MALKAKVSKFFEDAQRAKEERKEKKSAIKAKRRHELGAKYFGKHFQPAKDWVKNHPLPSARVLFSNVGPSSTRQRPLSDLVHEYCSSPAPVSPALETKSKDQPTLSALVESTQKVVSPPPNSTSAVNTSPTSSNSTTLTPAKSLSRTQKRKAKIRAHIAANPDEFRSTRRQRKSVDRIVYDIKGIVHKHRNAARTHSTSTKTQ